MPRGEVSAPAPGRRATATSDEELVRGLRRASEAHFNEVYERYFQRIYSYTYLRVRNRADAEELTQEVFTSVFCSIDAFRGRSSLQAWIYGIARNTVNNAIRRARIQDDRLAKAGPGVAEPVTSLGDGAPDEQLGLRLMLDSIRDRLETVTPWQAEVFRLRHIENLSIGEICQRTSRSNDAVRSSLYRVKRLLHDAQAADGTDRAAAVEAGL